MSLYAPQVVQPVWHLQEPEPTCSWLIANFTKNLLRLNQGIVQEKLKVNIFNGHGYKMKLAINLNEAHCSFAGYLGVYLILMQIK